MRARTDTAKKKRKQSILEAAGNLLKESDYHSIKVIDIANESNIAKGTVFSYFNTKEHIFLELIKKEYIIFFNDLNSFLLEESSTSATRQIVEIAPYLTHYLQGKDTFLKLITILNVVLEKNIQIEEAVTFKKMLSENIKDSGFLLEKCYSSLKDGQGAQILLQIQGIIIGLRNLTDIAPIVRSAIELNEELKFFNIQFENLFVDLLSAYLKGITK